MDLFCEGGGGTVDAGIVDTAEHEHLVVGFVAEAAGLADFVHLLYLYQSTQIIAHICSSSESLEKVVV